MTIQELIDLLGAYSEWILGIFAVPPAAAWVLGLLPVRRTGPLTFWDYAYSVIIYLVGIPGMISAVLIAYSLFIIRQSLLQVDFLVYFLPVASMAATFYLIKRVVDLDRLPGFDRLSGLMLLIGLTFLVVFVLFKLRILVGFFASLEVLVGLGLVLFVLFKVAVGKLFR